MNIPLPPLLRLLPLVERRKRNQFSSRPFLLVRWNNVLDFFLLSNKNLSFSSSFSLRFSTSLSLSFVSQANKERRCRRRRRRRHHHHRHRHRHCRKYSCRCATKKDKLLLLQLPLPCVPVHRVRADSSLFCLVLSLSLFLFLSLACSPIHKFYLRLNDVARTHTSIRKALKSQHARTKTPVLINSDGQVLVRAWNSGRPLRAQTSEHLGQIQFHLNCNGEYNQVSFLVRSRVSLTPRDENSDERLVFSEHWRMTFLVRLWRSFVDSLRRAVM